MEATISGNGIGAGNYSYVLGDRQFEVLEVGQVKMGMPLDHTQ